ncbi:MAG: hypothetical protein HRU35_01395 [Rickettsiaceae bacterium]|nr:hypothetical protein [Rickettsiaceae bacterium]
MSEGKVEDNFKFASSLIKIITLVMALILIVASRYAFIFFSAAMLPAIIAIFLDRHHHKCLSATICSFNLIGALPYLVTIWESRSIDYSSQQIISNFSTWLVIYGAAAIGQLLYISMPLLIVKIYQTKKQVNINKLEKKYKEICEKWGIDYEM